MITKLELLLFLFEFIPISLYMFGLFCFADSRLSCKTWDFQEKHPTKGEKNGGLGTSCYSSSAIRIVDTRASVSTTREKQGNRICQPADQWSLYICPHHYLFWSDHHFSHCHWRPHHHRLIALPDFILFLCTVFCKSKLQLQNNRSANPLISLHSFLFHCFFYYLVYLLHGEVCT